jgi:hypothetical protein
VPATQEGDTGFHKGRNAEDANDEHRDQHDAGQGAGPRDIR